MLSLMLDLIFKNLILIYYLLILNNWKGCHSWRVQ
jgi:hypothetical protein